MTLTCLVSFTLVMTLTCLVSFTLVMTLTCLLSFTCVMTLTSGEFYLRDDVDLEDGHAELEVLAAPDQEGAEAGAEELAHLLQPGRLRLRLGLDPGGQQRLPVHAGRAHVDLSKQGTQDRGFICTI